MPLRRTRRCLPMGAAAENSVSAGKGARSQLRHGFDCASPSGEKLRPEFSFLIDFAESFCKFHTPFS